MRRIKENTFEIDVLDIIAMVFGTAFIVFGLIFASLILIVGLSLFGLIIWGRTSLKIIAIIFSVVILFVIHQAAILLTFTDFILIGFGYDVLLSNYMMLWPIVISATISIFSIVYAWKGKEKVMNIAVCLFLFFSAVISTYNTIRMVETPTLEAYIFFWLLNFSIYLFSYIIAFSVYYFIVILFKLSSTKINNFLVNYIQENGKNSNLLGTELKNNQTTRNKTFESMYYNVTTNRIFADSKKPSLITKLKGGATLIIGVIGTAVMGFLFYFFMIDSNLNEIDIPVFLFYIMTITFFVMVIITGTLQLQRPNTKFMNSGLPFILEGLGMSFIIGVFIIFWLMASSSFSPQETNIMMTIVIILVSFCLVYIGEVYSYQLFKKEKGLSVKCYDPFQYVISPIGFGIILIVLVFSFYALLWPLINNIEAETTIALLLPKAAFIIVVIFAFLNFGITYISTGIIRAFNKTVRLGEFFIPIKISIDLVMLGFFINSLFSGIAPEPIMGALMVISLFFIIFGIVGYLYCLFSNMFTKTQKKSEKTLVTHIDKLLKSSIIPTNPYSDSQNNLKEKSYEKILNINQKEPEYLF